LENKSAKIDIFTDPRDKNGKSANRVDIPCKHFMEAVEKDLYGWKWECPNGGDKCQYNHSVPPGFIPPKDREVIAKDGDDEDELTLEEKIEEERAALPYDNLTPVTFETFMDWKKRKAERKQKELEEKMKEEAKKSGKGSNILSGKALFKYDPTLFKDDENAADNDIYNERNEEEEKKNQENQEDGNYE